MSTEEEIYDAISASAERSGGPAFPLNRKGPWDQEGMSLRDWYAGQALICMGTWMPAGFGNLDSDEAVERRATWAYLQADAMLAARKANGAA